MATLTISKSRKEYDFHILFSQDGYSHGNCYMAGNAVVEVVNWVTSFMALVDEDSDLVVQLSYDSRVS